MVTDTKPKIKTKDEKIEELKLHIKDSIARGEKQISKIFLENLLKNLKGFNSLRIRHLLNNLCSIDGTCYLELGAYRGSSAVCALWKNNAVGYVVDNFKYNYFHPEKYNKEGWKEVRKNLAENLQRFQAKDKITVLEGDADEIDLSQIKHHVNVLYYDIEDTKSSFKNLSHFLPKMAQVSIIVANHSRVTEIPEGIDRALERNNIKIHERIYLKSNNLEDNRSWWSGITIWLIEKEGTKKEKDD